MLGAGIGGHVEVEPPAPRSVGDSGSTLTVPYPTLTHHDPSSNDAEPIPISLAPEATPFVLPGLVQFNDPVNHHSITIECLPVAEKRLIDSPGRPSSQVR